MQKKLYALLLGITLLFATKESQAQFAIDFDPASPITNGSVVSIGTTSLTISSSSGFSSAGDAFDGTKWGGTLTSDSEIRFNYSYNSSVDFGVREVTFTFADPVIFASGGFYVYDFGHASFTLRTDAKMNLTTGTIIPVFDQPVYNGYIVSVSSDRFAANFFDIEGSTHGSMGLFFIPLQGPVTTIKLELTDSFYESGSGSDYGAFLFGSVTPAPEPSGAFLLSLVGGLALLRRGRKAQAV